MRKASAAYRCLSYFKSVFEKEWIMKTSLFLALSLIATAALAEMSTSGPASTLPSSMAPVTATSMPVPTTSTSIPQAGTAAGSPQTAGPLNSAPNGAGGTYGYPNNAVDPNTTNPGLPQPTYFGGPYYNYGTTSGTTSSANPAGAPFVTPPNQNTNGVTPAAPYQPMNR